MMAWRNYRDQFLDYREAVQCADVAIAVATRVLKDFPHRLPERVRREITSGLKRLAETLSEATQAKETNEERPRKVSLTPLAQKSFLILMYRSLAGKTAGMARIRFDPILLAAELIAVMAYTEAFLNDSLRAIAVATPRIETS
jgi:hypothetical protein